MPELPILTSTNYQKFLSKQDRLVMLIFDAAWASPALDVVGITVKLGQVDANRIFVVRICLDSEPDLARGLGVTALPRVLFLLRGQKVGSIEGLHHRSFYHQKIDLLLDFAENSDPTWWATDKFK